MKFVLIKYKISRFNYTDLILEKPTNHQMECLRCKLRFNITSRKPYILPCLHNVCCSCLRKIQSCSACQLQKQSINQLSDLSKAKLNKSVLELVSATEITYDKTVKICLLGNSKVGKSSVANLLKGLPFSNNYNTTIGYQYTFLNKNLRQNIIKYQIWDTAGDSKYIPSSQLHLKNVDIFIIVYDLSRECQENQVQKWLQLAEKHSKKNSQQKQSHIILVGNKVDLIQKVVKSISSQLWTKIVDKNYQNVQISCSDEYESINQSPDYLTLWDKIQQSVSDNMLIKQDEYKKSKQLDKISISTDGSLDLQTQKLIKNDQPTKNKVIIILNKKQHLKKEEQTLQKCALTPLTQNLVYSRSKDKMNKLSIEQTFGLKRSKQVKRSF